MNSTGNETWCLKIDYSQLMDLRVDYAFKLLFVKGDPRLLISLLNAIFANKKIHRIIKSLTIKNPFLEKESSEDKLAILDIRAELDDGTTILIEMHLYGLGELKAKTIRSWARAFGEELVSGDKFAEQLPTITIAFVDGAVKPLVNVKKKKGETDKIHRLCMIMDRDDCSVFTDVMELHYIDMRAFAKAVNEAGNINIAGMEASMFAKWLSVITQKEIKDKSIIANICKDEEDMQVAVSTLARQSEDKYIRQAYQRRQDESYFFNKNMFEKAKFKQEAEEANQRAEQADQRAEQERQRAEQADRRAEQADRRAEQERQHTEQEKYRAERAEAENEKLRQQIATLQASQEV